MIARLGYRHVRTEFAVPAHLDPLQRHPKAPAPGEPIRRHNPLCFGCGADSAQGLHLVVRAAEESAPEESVAEEFAVETEMTVEARMEGGPGVIHGGILSTAMDEVMGTAPLLVGPAAITVHLEVDFIAPVPIGSTLHLRARILGKQRRKIYVEAIGHLGDPQQPVAVGHSIFVTIDARDHFADHLANSGLSDEHKRRLSRP
ncbi:PaaI family thioesterase [Gordonia sp. NPDC003425]